MRYKKKTYYNRRRTSHHVHIMLSKLIYSVNTQIKDRIIVDFTTSRILKLSLENNS